MKVLIIEDEQITAKLLAKKLKNLGFEICIANDGYSGVETAHREKPDIILLDMMLPGGNGLSVLQRLKLSYHTKDTPVIALTSITDEDFKEKAIKAGVDVYLTKPYDAKTLLNSIFELTQKDEFKECLFNF